MSARAKKIAVICAIVALALILLKMAIKHYISWPQSRTSYQPTPFANEQALLDTALSYPELKALMGASDSQYQLHNLSVNNAVEAHQISSMPEIGWENTTENWEDDIKSSQGLAFGVTHHQSPGDRGKLIATVIGVIL